MKTKYQIVYIILFLLFTAQSCLLSARRDTTKSPFARFLERLYENSRLTINKPTLEFNYGISAPSFPQNRFNSTLARAYMGEIKYGFTRFNDRTFIEDVFSYASEYVFLRNASSHFKPKTVDKNGITTDGWQFGGGINSGYGYYFGDSELILYHAGAFVWSRIDVEMLPPDKNDSDLLKLYDEDYRFGTYFRGGIKYHISGPMYLDAGYENTQVYPRTVFWRFFISWIIENASQRWIDFFEPEFIDIHGKNWPWLNFVIKNGISLALYELRRNNMNWPFDSAPPLDYDSFKIGMTFVF